MTTAANSTPHAPTGSPEFLAGGGEMGALMRSFDWSKVAIGSPEGWPQSLRTTVSILVNSAYPMFVAWGADLAFLYNDGYRPIFGHKHPAALGRPFAEIWAEIWTDIHPLVERALSGERTWADDMRLFMERSGYREECYFTFSYSPVRDESGGIGGMFCACTETTDRVLSERRTRTLQKLGSAAVDAKTVEDAKRLCLLALETNHEDLPFALLYEFREERAYLAGWTGAAPDESLAPRVAALDVASPWPFSSARRGETSTVDQLTVLLGYAAPASAWGEPTNTALVVPIAGRAESNVRGALVLGISPRRVLDDGYLEFLGFVGGSVATALANAEAFENERRRAEALAELDRAKTTFFSNASHEFRTPLTLMLGPIDDILERPERDLLSQDRELLTVVRRNGLRLQKLVNTLLDFSRIQAGRVEAAYEPVDLSALTADVVSSFRTAIEKAGMRLVVHCPPLPEPVFVDKEMWEKIVLNLVSNAFKYTLAGEIRVGVGTGNNIAVLTVEDTGIGIPERELPNLFTRFHRVEGSRGRTYEGTGIGLALVAELAKLHGGSVGVQSQLGKGSVFTVEIPFGKRHLPPDSLHSTRTLSSTAIGAEPYVEEALRWLPGVSAEDIEIFSKPEMPISPHGTEAISRPRILLADDNADMRDYVRRLLSADYDVMVVRDGQEALRAVARQIPDLIVSDVMMPKLDGFGLLKALRADDRTVSVPVILISARAGEEATIEGVQAGADDYITKPFSARELLARVSGTLALARLRREANAAVRESEERFRHMADNSPQMIWVTDKQAYCQFLNRRWLEFTGQALESALGFGWLEAVHPDDRGWSKDIFLEANSTHAPFQLEYRLRRRDGAFRWAIDAAAPRFSEDGTFLGYIGSVSDITERKEREYALETYAENLRRSEERLRESEERLRAAGSAADVGTWRVDLRTQLDTRDSNLNRLLGLEPVDSTQHVGDFVDRLHPEDRAAVAAEIARAIREQGIYKAECRVILPDGTVRWLCDQGRVLLEDGEPRYMTGAAIDVTAQKQHEEALRIANQDLEQFAYSASHDLQEPIRNISISGEILSRRYGQSLDASGREHLSYMTNGARRMEMLVRDLLAFTQSASTGEVSDDVDSKAALGKALSNLSTAIREADAEITHGQLPTLRVSEVQLQQLFQNLIGNAVKYRKDDERPRIHVSAERNGNRWLFAVRDNGIGIAPEYRERVFGIFKRLHGDGKYSGTGIGLAICQRIVERNGGRIWVESNRTSSGSTFYFTLPVDSARMENSHGRG